MEADGNFKRAIWRDHRELEHPRLTLTIFFLWCLVLVFEAGHTDLTSHTRLPLPPSARTTGALAQDLA